MQPWPQFRIYGSVGICCSGYGCICCRQKTDPDRRLPAHFFTADGSLFDASHFTVYFMCPSCFIVQHQESTLQEWETFARMIVPPSFAMDNEVVRNHASRMLDTIAADLDCSQKPFQQQKSLGRELSSNAETSAETDAMKQLRSGYTIAQRLAPYRALRSSILKQSRNDWQDVLTTDAGDVTRFNAAIDQALAAPVARFAKLFIDTAEAERQRLKVLLKAASIGSALAGSNRTFMAIDASNTQNFGAPRWPENADDVGAGQGCWTVAAKQYGQLLNAQERVAPRARAGAELAQDSVATELVDAPGQRCPLAVEAASVQGAHQNGIRVVIA